MEWSNATSLDLIGYYRERECLWNPTNVDYKNKVKRIDAWKEISDFLDCDVSDVKKKMESLLTSFRRERQRELTQSRSADEAYKSTWFAFRSMFFLLDKLAVKNTDSTKELPDQNIEVRHSYKEKNRKPDDAITDNVRDSRAIPNSSIQNKSHLVDSSAPEQCKRFRADETYDVMKAVNEKRCTRDASAIYGEYIACKHRKYSDHTRSVLEHLVGEILFKADMGCYEKKYASPDSQPQDGFHGQYISNYHICPSPLPTQPSPSSSVSRNSDAS